MATDQTFPPESFRYEVVPWTETRDAHGDLKHVYGRALWTEREGNERRHPLSFRTATAYSEARRHAESGQSVAMIERPLDGSPFRVFTKLTARRATAGVR